MVQKIRKNSVALMGLGLFTLVLITAAVVAGQTPAYVSLVSPNHSATIEARHLEASTSHALGHALEAEEHNLLKTSQLTVPPIMLASLPSDFATVQDPKKRQDLFLRALIPIVLIENRRIYEQRVLAKFLLEDEQPVKGTPMHDWLKGLARQLRVRGELKDPEVISRILNRLDIIPLDLALAQAAIETGWGTSRFALEGNSLFGQWTFQSTGGIKPSERESDAKHFVASFPDLRGSVRAYMRNLNTGRAYSKFRIIRAQLRAEGKPLQGEVLARYLQRYSQRGEQYVAEIRRLIKSQPIASLAKANLGKKVNNLVMASLNTGVVND